MRASPGNCGWRGLRPTASHADRRGVCLGPPFYLLEDINDPTGGKVSMNRPDEILMSASPIKDNFGTADRGLCRGTISATLRGDFGILPATGKSATAPIAEIFRIPDGQIVEVWVYPDTLSIMGQFGLIPTSGGA